MDQIYDLAISFAGENRAIAENLAKRLDAVGYSIFYDDFEVASLWGSDLPVRLGNIYGSESRYCLILVSEYYLRKMWTNHERQHAISAFMAKGGDYILPLKIDNSEIPGLPPTIGYQSLVNGKSLDDIFQILLQKLGDPLPKIDQNDLSLDDKEYVRQIIAACFRRAFFTKMDSEIQLDAMFRSIAESLRSIQPIIPKIRDLSIQHICLKIVSRIDEIERFKLIYPDQEYSNHIKKEDKKIMDETKIHILNFLLKLRRKAQIRIHLPTELSFDHFYTLDQANQEPKIRP